MKHTIIIILLIFAGIQIPANAQTTMTASVPLTNCNLQTTKLPPPTITNMTHTEHGYEFEGYFGEWKFTSKRSADKLEFWVGDAYWYTNGVQVYYGECLPTT